MITRLLTRTMYGHLLVIAMLPGYYMTIVKLLIIQGRVHDAAQKFVVPIIIVTLPMLQVM